MIAIGRLGCTKRQLETSRTGPQIPARSRLYAVPSLRFYTTKLGMGPDLLLLSPPVFLFFLYYTCIPIWLTFWDDCYMFYSVPFSFHLRLALHFSFPSLSLPGPFPSVLSSLLVNSHIQRFSMSCSFICFLFVLFVHILSHFSHQATSSPEVLRNLPVRCESNRLICQV